MDTDKKKRNRQRGATIVEYMLIVVLIAVSGIALFKRFGTAITVQMDNNSKAVQGLKPVTE